MSDEIDAFLDAKPSNQNAPIQKESMSPNEIGTPGEQLTPQILGGARNTNAEADAFLDQGMPSRVSTPQPSSFKIPEDIDAFLDAKPNPDSAYLTAPSPTPEQTGKVINLPATPSQEQQPEGQVEAGNIDLNKRPVVKNADGTISTVRSISIGTDKGEVLIPTVSEDGKIMSNDEAIAQYKQTGNNLGTFANVDAANNYAQQLHNNQAKQYAGGQPMEPAKRPVGFFEAAGRGVVGELAKSNESMAQGMGTFPYLEDKTLKAFGIDSDIYNRYMNAVHATGLGKPTEEAMAIKPTEELTTAGKIGMGIGSMGASLPYMMMSGAIGAEQAAASEALQVIKPLMSSIRQGIQAMLPMATQSGIDAVKQSAQQGDKPLVQAAKGMAQATATAVVGTIPLAMRSKISNGFLRTLEQGAYGYITGIPVAESQKVVSSWINGEPYVPSEFKEMAIQAVPMALMTGAFGYLHAPAKSPKLKPSTNPDVNKKEGEILASADAQYSPPLETKVEEVTTSAATPSGETKAPAADLTSLLLDQTLHEEGSPEYAAIQKQIDALKTPAPAEVTPAKGPTPKLPATGGELTANLVESGTELESFGKETLAQLAEHYGIDIPEGASRGEIIDAIKNKKPAEASVAESTTPKPNAVQVTSTTETMLRPQVTGQGEVVELPRVGEQNAQVPTTEAKAKEEVAPKKLENPYQDIVRRYASPDADSFKSTNELVVAVEQLANNQKNKFLKEAVDKFREGMQVGEEIEFLVDRLMAEVEREGNYQDQGVKPSERGLPKADKKGREGYFISNNPIISYLNENRIRSKTEQRKYVKSQGGKMGGEYDDAPKLPTSHSSLIYGGDQSIDQAHEALVASGIMSPESSSHDLWIKIDEASKSATKLEKEEAAKVKTDKEQEKRNKELEVLRTTNPDAYIAEQAPSLQGHFDRTRRRNEGAFFEFPQPIQEAAIKVGEAVYKAGMTFRDWAGKMTSLIGDGVKNFLRQIWDGWKSLGRSGGVGRRPLSDEEALRREQEASKYAPKAPTEQEEFAKKAADAILKGRGTPITEEEMGSILARKFPGIGQGAVNDLFATASGKPKAAGYAGVFAEPSQQGTMFEQRTTGLKKSVVKQERLSRGLEDIPAQERQSETERVQRAVDRVQSDSAVAPSIVARIVDAKEPNISVDDAAALLVERNRLMNDRQNWENILDDESKSPAERYNAEQQLNSIEEQLNRLDEAQRATGSEWGRLGRMYQRMIAEDYSLESMERKERRNLGRPLEKPEREKLKKEAESIQKTTEELQAAQEKAQTEQEKVAVAETYWKTIQELKAELASRPKIEPQFQRIIDRVGSALKSQADKASERVRKRIKEGRFNVGLDPEDIIDHAIIGANYIYEGANNISKFTTRMVKELGEYVRPYIKEIFAASQQEYDRTTDKVAGNKSDAVKEKQKPKQQTSISQIKATGKAEKTANPFLPNLEHLEDPLTHKLVYELARQHILEGVKGEDNVMKAVHNDIKDVYPDATERDVRRAFSEYGKAKFPSKEADRVALAELRTLTRLQESIDRLTEGLPALKSGLQRNKNTQLIREKQAKLNELLKKVKLPPTEEELASKDAAKQTALRNRIADLDKQLRTGEKLKRTPTEPDSPETENLRLEKNAMEQLLKEIEGETKPKKTPEEAYNERRQKAIRKKIAEIEDRIKNNRYEAPPKRIPTAKNTDTQRLELELKRKQNEFDRRQLVYQEERKPRWQKIMQGTSELAKGMAITGYHSLEKILGFDLAKMITTPIEEFTGSAVSKLTGIKPKEGSLESGGSTIGGLLRYYKGLVKGAIEAPKVLKTGLSESEELFGKVRPNVARWYDFIGGRLHASLKHIPFTAQEELYRYRGLANAEKVAPGSTKSDLVKMAIYKAAYERAQSAKLQEANKVAEAINGYFTRLEQIDPKTGKSSVAGNVVSAFIKTFITKGIIKTPANYFKQVMRGIIGVPEGAGRVVRAYWNGIENLTPEETDAIYKAFKVGGIGFAAGLYGYIDSFKDKKKRVLGGYYQAGRKEGDGDAKWGTIRIGDHTFHYIAHNPVTEIMQFGSTVGRVQQAMMKKTDMPTAIATGFAKSLIALLGSAPVSGPLMRLGQPYSSPINEISRGLVPALISNIAQDTKGDKKYAPTNPLQQIEANIPGLQKLVPLAKPKGGSSSSSKPWYERTTRSSSGKPWYEK